MYRRESCICTVYAPTDSAERNPTAFTYINIMKGFLPMDEGIKIYENPEGDEREEVSEEVETENTLSESSDFDFEVAIAEIKRKLEEIENKITTYDLKPIIASLRTLVNITDTKTEKEDYNGRMY